MARIIKRRNRIHTQNNIVNAAIQAIVKKDMDTVGVHFVADLAGNNKVLIYRYFGGWNGLAEAVFKKVVSDLHRNTIDKMAKDNLTGFEAIIYVFVEYLNDQLVLSRILEWVSKNPDVVLAMSWEQEYAMLFQKILEMNHRNSNDEIALIRLILDGFAFQFISKRKIASKQIAQAVSLIRVFYLNKELLRGSIRIVP